MAAAVDTRAKTIRDQLEREVEEFNNLQKESQKSHGARQKVVQQLEESKTVHAELKQLHDDSVVYKLIGPVLVRQDLVEAKINVEKRIEYIEKEAERLEHGLKAIEGKQREKQDIVRKQQEKLQKLMAEQASAAGK